MQRRELRGKISRLINLQNQKYTIIFKITYFTKKFISRKQKGTLIQFIYKLSEEYKEYSNFCKFLNLQKEVLNIFYNGFK